MAEKLILKDPSLKPAENGGFIVQYDKCCESENQYDGLRYLGRGEEIFEDGDDALARLIEIQGDAPKVMSAKIKAEKKKAKSADKY